MTKYAPRALAFAMGFLSLSQEILWIRYSAFAYQGVPQVLGVVLCFYLAGIALGANIGKKWCTDGRDLYRAAGVVLLVSGAFDALAPWAVTFAMQTNKLLGVAVLVPTLIATALFKSIVFPIAHHLGSDKSGPHVGSSVSKVYFSNIAGSTLGPLLTGFVLLQFFGLQQNFSLMAVLTAGTGLLCLFWSAGRIPLAASLGALAIAGALLLPRTLLLRLIDASHYNPGVVRHVVENRFGVIHVASYPQEPDNTFGGNAYDGKISVDFMNDTNVIFRLYALAALHPQSREILTIGLSTGAWAAVLQGFPQAQRIDAVEINPGYLDIIPQYPEVRGVLSDPRVHVHIDDGRRWVRRNPQARFDLIVLNSTWHWRSYASLLLSQDFVRMCKSRLRPDGIFAYNTTESPDAYETMASEFRYVYKLHNFAIGSDRELSLTDASFADTLRAMRVNGEPVIASWNEEAARRIHEGVSEFMPYAEYRAKVVATLGREPEIITDQNLVGEYRHSDSSPVADQVRRILARLSGRTSSN